LSKAYGVIRCFSEDADLTYDIRAIARDLVGDADAPLPASASQEKKWTKEIRARLSDWVGAKIVPGLKLDLEHHGHQLNFFPHHQLTVPGQKSLRFQIRLFLDACGRDIARFTHYRYSVGCTRESAERSIEDPARTPVWR
jgi:hypothetical protein